MTFFKDNKKYIVKLILTHLVMTVFGLMVFIPFNRDDMSMKAFLIVGGKLSDDCGIRYIFLAGLFIWGVAWSFSKKRTRGEIIAYRLLSKLSDRDG